MQLSDRETVELICDKPYIQYFLGYPDYQYELSLDASLLTHFRKRFPADVIAQVNRWVVDAMHHPDDDDTNSSDTNRRTEDTEVETKNHGTLILDASCALQDIQYPTDIRLLHESRLKLEAMMDTLQTGRTEAKPRNYRQKANKEYNRFSRHRRPRKSRSEPLSGSSCSMYQEICVWWPRCSTIQRPH